MSETTAAGWYPDPTGRHPLRWHDGANWTDQVSDGGGVASTDPLGAGAAPIGAFAPGPPVAAPKGRSKAPLVLLAVFVALALAGGAAFVLLGGGDDALEEDEAVDLADTVLDDADFPGDANEDFERDGFVISCGVEAAELERDVLFDQAGPVGFDIDEGSVGVTIAVFDSSGSADAAVAAFTDDAAVECQNDELDFDEESSFELDDEAELQVDSAVGVALTFDDDFQEFLLPIGQFVIHAQAGSGEDGPADVEDAIVDLFAELADALRAGGA